MNRPSIALFGISYQNSNLNDVVLKYIDLLTKNPSEQPTHHITTVNSLQIASTHGWGFSSVINPELLAILRQSDITTAAGKTLMRLSKWLGSPLQEQITDKMLLEKLAQTLGKNEKGVFLLGSTEYLSKTAGIALHEFSPGLRIVGIATPHLYTEGEDIANAFARDALLIEQINASNADLLVINFDSPKHEIWFNRVKKHLKVPLAMGIATPLKSITTVSQKVQNPPKKERLSILNSFKIAWMLLSLVTFHNLNRLVFRLIHEKHSRLFLKNNILFISPHRTIASITLPPLIDNSNVISLANRIDESSGHDILILDFRHVRHIQPEGFSFLINTWLNLSQANKTFFGFCPTHDIKLLMQLHRTWDLFKNQMIFSAEMLLSRLPHNDHTTEFYDAINQKGPLVIISLFGALDNTLDYESYLKRLTPIVTQKDCTLDFSFCTSVSNSGFSFLLELRDLIQHQGHKLTLHSLTNTVKQQFRITKVETLFF